MKLARAILLPIFLELVGCGGELPAETAGAPATGDDVAIDPALDAPEAVPEVLETKDAPSDVAKPKADAPVVDVGGGGGVVLGVSGDRFTIDGTPKFLLGVSYFSCLYASDATLASDLDWLSSKGFSLLRCWVEWPIVQDPWTTDSPSNLSLIGKDGKVVPAALARLQAVLVAARVRGMVVDLTFNQDTPPKTYAAHVAGMVEAGKALAPYRNALFDLQNETSHWTKMPDFFMSPTQAKAARDAVRGVDAGRVLTASVTSTAALSDFVGPASLDVAAYHCCRNVGTITDWAAATFDAVGAARAAIAPAKVPIYFQEPNRCGVGGQYAICKDGSEFVKAAVNAKKAGAAAWVFHNTASYDLRGGTLQSRLSAAEKDAVAKLAPAL